MIRSILLVTGLLLALPSFAQTPPGFLPENIRYDGSLRTPKEAFGHSLGERTLRDGQVTSYLREIAAQSDRVTIETIGYSHEGRPIDFLVVTAPGNHARIEQIRERHVALSDPDSDAEVAADMPVILFLGWGVHGAEAAGLEAAVPVVYHLAAGRGSEIERMLENSVVLMVAPMNPDGHARRIDHSLSFMSKAIVRNPESAGHDLWARQRTNHYGSDLNRQWLLLAHPEARAWMEQWHAWKPNLTSDYHEMGTTSTRPTTYYFPPSEPGRTNRLIPEETQELVNEVGRYHQAAFDERNDLYFTEELFDTYFIGTGSSYPQMNGGVGMLFETGTAKLIEIDTPLGRRSLAQNIELHLTTALTSIAAAVDMRERLLDYQRRFALDAIDLARADIRAAFVFTSPDRSRLAHFVDLLVRHDLQVHHLKDDLIVNDTNYAAEDSYIVPLAQSQYRMIRTIFDRVTEFENPLFYDVSGWTLSLSYNIEHDALSRGQMGPGLIGDLVTPDFPSPAAPEPGSYGYVFSWTDHYAPRALYRVLDHDLIARAALKPFTAKTTQGDLDLKGGSIFVPLAGQPHSHAIIHEIMTQVADKDGVEVHAVVSGKTSGPGVDLGSGGSFGTVEKPEILLLIEGGIQHFDMGDIWHLLDDGMRIPVTLKQKERISEITWDRYTHIILPGGRNIGLDAAATRRARQWIEEGGTFIGIRHAAEWAQEAFLDRHAVKSEIIGVGGPERFDLAELRAHEARDVVSGSIFASDLDLSHPLAFGYHRRLLPSNRDTVIVLETPDNPIAAVAQYVDGDPVLSGYVSDRRKAELAGTPMLIAERLGSGTVVLMTDNPNFRGAFLGTHKLLLNSIFFSRMFNPPRQPGGAHYRP